MSHLDTVSQLRTVLLEHVRAQRWFRGKARKIRELEVLDYLPLSAAASELALVVIAIHYEAGAEETYVLPLGFGQEGEVQPLARLGRSVVHDPSGQDELAHALLELFVREQTRGERGVVSARPSAALRALLTGGGPQLAPRTPSGEQSNTTLFFGRELMLKLFRQLEPGENPDVELNEQLWTSGYRHIPEPLGSLHYQRNGTGYTLGLAQRFVPSEGIAWEVTLEVLARSFELARKLVADKIELVLPRGDMLDSAAQTPPEPIDGFVSAYAPFATLLGERTAELHTTLAAQRELPAFAPEPFTVAYQRALVQTTRERIARAFELLGEQRQHLPAEARTLAEQVLGSRDALTRQLEVLDHVRVRASRIRCHGDYHLGQLLYGHNDFTILDFEGEPAQPLAARRQKQSALYDVAGMIRSFHYAATVALQAEREPAPLAPWADCWFRWITAAFLCAYLRKARERGPVLFLPEDPAELRALFRLHAIDKCSYELSYELNNRPAWVAVPLAGLQSLVTAA